jgi:hypothetical protein
MLLLFLFYTYFLHSKKMKRQEPSGAHFRKLRKWRTKAAASFQVFMAAFFKGCDSSASSGIPENQQNESLVSENPNDYSLAAGASNLATPLLGINRNFHLNAFRNAQYSQYSKAAIMRS